MSLPDIVSSGAVAFMGAILSAVVSWFYARQTIPRSHRVAVIGFPQAGKTSLIVALFAFYFRRQVRGVNIMPRGEETIRRVNAHIAEMESGLGVSPTRDQDLFAFRAEVHRRAALPWLNRRYKLEIGDFPGEQSEEFITSPQPWLHNTNYFEWAMGADAFIFVVDCLKVYFDNDNYVAEQKRAFRAAMQRIEEHHIDGKTRLRRKTAVLVYAKADTILDVEYDGADRMVRLSVLKKEMDLKFLDLIEYFQNSLPEFKTILSSVANRDSGERLGIEELATEILPKSL